MVGEWTLASEGETPWVETCRPLGDIWIVIESRGRMPDGSAGQTLLTLGFDPKRQRFVGTWIGSMMTHMWVYDGTLDETGTELTLDCQGPDFFNPDNPEMIAFRDIVTLKDRHTRLLRSESQQPDGSWKKFMSMEYRRTAG